MKHLSRPDASDRRVETRFTDAFTRIQKLNAFRFDFWEKILLFAQIRAASPSSSYDGHLFHEEYEQDKFYICIRSFKLCDERG